MNKLFLNGLGSNDKAMLTSWLFQLYCGYAGQHPNLQEIYTEVCVYVNTHANV